MTNENGSNPLLSLFTSLMGEYQWMVEDYKVHVGRIPPFVPLRLPHTITGVEALALLGMAYLALPQYKLTFTAGVNFYEIGVHH
jgi:hypothetical protein